MQHKGQAVTVTERIETKGKLVEVNLPGEGLSLIFVIPELCQQPGVK